MNAAELKQVKEYFSALAEAEAAVGKFYALCAEYRQEEELWKKTAGEESRHSDMVLKMLAALGKVK
jgi:hypothetical protein